MSSATASARRRPSGPPRSSGAGRNRKRAAAARRRRTVVRLALAAAVVVAVIMALPLAKRAVNEFGLPLQYASTIRQQAAAERLDPALVAGVIYAETKFDPRTSSAGAEGLMQLMPQTALFLAQRSGATTFTVADLNHPAVNITYGCYYLRHLIDEFHGHTVEAIAAYNGGAANVFHWLAEARADHHRFRIADIPFPETRDYVQRVLQARSDYRRTYPGQLGLG